MDNSTIKKISKNRVIKSMETIEIRKTYILKKLSESDWMDEDKREAIKTMIEIFVDFADELAKRNK